MRELTRKKKDLPESNRKETRLSICLPVQIQLPDKPGLALSGEIRNLSEGGAYVVSHFPIEVGQQILLTIEFRKLHTLEVIVVANPKLESKPVQESSIVRWTDPSHTGAFGVEFNGLDEPTRELIRSLLQYFQLLKKAGVKF